jgi:hypothetical protein
MKTRVLMENPVSMCIGLFILDVEEEEEVVEGGNQKVNKVQQKVTLKWVAT